MKHCKILSATKIAFTALLLMLVFFISSYAADTNTEFAQRCIGAWKSKTEIIDIQDLNLSANSLKELFSTVLIDNCEYFYVKPSYSYSTMNNKIAKIQFNYADYTDEQIKNFNNTLKAVVKKADAYKTSLDKALFFHEYLIKTTKFNLYDSGRTAYDCLIKKSCVCEGFSKCYKLLLNSVGIKCYYVSSDENVHSWNIVELGEKKYYADIAWDDSTMTNNHFLTSYDKCVKNEHFNTKQDWLVDYTLNCSGKYNNKEYDNAFWTDAVQGLTYSDGLWYYSDGLNIYSYSTATNTKKKLATVTGNWFVWDKPNYYYPSGFSHVAVIGNWVYYNTSTTVRCVKKNGTDDKQVWKIPNSYTTYGYIYDIEASGTRIKYHLAKGPVVNGFEYTKTGSFLPDTHTHKYTVTLTKATQGADGKTVKVCTICNKKITTVIPKISRVSIGASTYTYNGRVCRPIITVTDTKGSKLKNGTDYTVKYSDKSSKSVGIYTVTVTFKGNYRGTKAFKYTITPQQVKITGVGVKKQALIITYSKATGVDGYQLYTATAINGTYKKVNTTTALTASTGTVKAGKTYYIKVRAYKKCGDKVIYGVFSDVKIVNVV